MRVGLTLSGDLLHDDGARFAAQLGVSDIVVHLSNYSRNADQTPYLAGGVGPIGGDCRGDRFWTFDDFSQYGERHPPKKREARIEAVIPA